jgi:hypothetical protein
MSWNCTEFSTLYASSLSWKLWRPLTWKCLKEREVPGVDAGRSDGVARRVAVVLPVLLPVRRRPVILSFTDKVNIL